MCVFVHKVFNMYHVSLQEQYQREQEKLKKEWEKAQLEVQEEERKHNEEVQPHTHTDKHIKSKASLSAFLKCCSLYFVCTSSRKEGF